MNDKQQILTALHEEFNRWEALLASLSEAQIVAPSLPDHMSIKDVIAHVGAWQQVSIARLEAAQQTTEPVLPAWMMGLDPDSEKDIDKFNARIHETYRARSWPQVHQDWSNGFRRFLTLGEEIPEHDLWEIDKYPWLKGYALVEVLQGSYEHHEEHLGPLLAWLQQHEKIKLAE